MRLILLAIFTSLLISCKNQSIEEQVDKLMQTEDSHDRQEIAYSLADSLNSVPITLLAKRYNENEYPKIALLDMLTKYSRKMSKSDNSEQRIILTLAKTITSPQIPVDGINNEQKLNLLINSMDNYILNKEFKRALVEIALSHGTLGLRTLINTWYEKKSSGLVLESIKSFGGDAVSLLVKDLGKDKNAEELLAYIGAPAVNALMLKMKSNNQEVRFSAADALVKMSKFNPDAVKNLTDVIDDQSLGAISKNYPFYIRLGSPGTEDLMLRALENYFNQTMCVDYLNCGNTTIENGAKLIAQSKGFNVFVEEGFHTGPKWGSEN